MGPQRTARENARRHGGTARALAGSLALVAAALGLAPAATGQLSGLGLAITPAFQSPVAVGQQNQPAVLQLVNESVGPQAVVDTVTVTNVRLHPACAGSAVLGGPGAPSPCGVLEPRPDPNLPILDLDDVSTAGTSCPGAPFAISGPDAEGDYAFTPTAGPLTLAPLGRRGESCLIHFTFDVVQAPTDGLTFQAAALLATSPSFTGGVPQTGASSVAVAQPPTTTTVPATTTTVPVAVLPAVVTTVPARVRATLASTGARAMVVPGLGLLLLGLVGLASLRRVRSTL